MNAKRTVILLILILSILKMESQVVADSTTHKPLPSASIFDCKGNVLGMTDSKGRIPHISKTNYPITVRYLGFTEKSIPQANSDTIFLQETFSDLPEVVVESRQHKVIHMLAYVREYSTLSTYTDTVFLFREKMVDYMLTPDKKVRFQGWNNPRILNSKSYYRFTNAYGLDSVSDKSNHHFSWSDWIKIIPPPKLPANLRNAEVGTDTLRGKYRPTEIWLKNHDKLTIDINVLADTTSRKWVPNLAVFFHNNLDFENFRVRFNYNNVVDDSISPIDLTGYSFNIESNGRERDMFRFNKVNETFYVSTYAEVYIVDKEYITIKEAKKWESLKFDTENIEIYEPADAPDLQPSILELIARVNQLDTDKVRLNMAPDHRLMGRHVVKQNIGTRALSLLKQLTGISYYRSRKNSKRNWNEFRIEQMRKNNGREVEE